LTAISAPEATYSNALTMNGITNFPARNVTLDAIGDSACAAAVNSGGSPVFQDVTITSTYYGILVVASNSKLTIDGARIASTSTDSGAGIFNNGVLNVINATITAEGDNTGGLISTGGISTGTFANTTIRNCVITVTSTGISEGIRIYNAVKVDGSEITASTGGSFGATSSAIHLSNNMSGTISNSRLSATATGGSNNTFAVNVESSVAANVLWIENSRLTAAYRAVSNFTGTVRIGASRLDGGVFASSCAAVWNGAGVFYSNVCP